MCVCGVVDVMVKTSAWSIREEKVEYSVCRVKTPEMKKNDVTVVGVNQTFLRIIS